MQRSRSRKLKRAHGTGRGRIPLMLWRAPIAAAIMAAIPRLYAADAPSGALEEVVVTAQKRAENLQDVPLSITAIGTEKLEQLGVQNFDDYVKFLPSVAYQSLGPGFARTFMRGVSSGDNGNHSGPLPSVGVYLDEQPITTIQGALDLHVYDIERVEALAGPQGTLYGASSEAGTVRIITNKPDLSGFKAGYNLQGNTVRGEGGYVAEGFVNVPLSTNAAIRLVGWAEHDGGFIDNVPNQFTYPSSGVCLANTNPAPAGCNTTPTLAKKRFNDSDTYGARGALKVDLSDNWTITPILMGQHTKANGNFAVDPSIAGDLSTSRYYPDSITDEWWQAALTLEGKISNFDITFASGYLKRDDHTQSDYTDYSFLYDQQTTYIAYFTNDAGALIDPSQHIEGRDHYRKFSNELRIDHSVTCPIITLRPQADLPIVPVYTNIFAPPLPQPKRFVELGRLLRRLVEAWPSDERVAIIGTGHLSLELGGPRQFGPHGPDPEFDEKAVEWISSGDIEGCLSEVTLDSLHQPGNATHGFMDFMLMMGVAGDGRKADYVDTYDLFHTMEAYFTWYPNGVTA